MRNEEKLSAVRFPTISVVAGGRQLRIVNAQIPDTASYRCIASNKAGEDFVDFSLQVQGILCSILILLFIHDCITIACVMLKMKKEVDL